MYKLSILLLFCLFLTSCQKVNTGVPDSEYTFEVYCNHCTISIENGNNSFSYYVEGHQSIPFSNSTPVIKIFLSTVDDKDPTEVTFTGSGYNLNLFNGYLYYDDEEREVDFNL